MKRTIIALLGLWTGVSGPGFGQTNSWLGDDGNWQTPSQWSLDLAPSSNQDILVTNTGTFTITINDYTASNFPGAMAVSSLSMSNMAGISTLLLTNPPMSTTPIILTITNNAVIGAGSVLDQVDSTSVGAGVAVQVSNLVADGSVILQANSTLSATGASPDYNVHVGSTANSTGSVSIFGGSLIANGNIAVGEQGDGCLMISNGVLQSGGVEVGVHAGADGVWRIAGGSNTVGGLGVGGDGGATGEVVMTGGQLAAPGGMGLGGGVGSLVLSNGVIDTGELDLADGINGVGTVTVAGGHLNVTNNMYVGLYGTGTVWVTGGEIDVTNSSQFSGLLRLVGEISQGTYMAQLVCSGGVLRATEVDVGHPEAPTFSGLSSWTIAGGTSIVNSAVYVANVPQHTSLLTVSGGLLQTPDLEVGTLSGGGVVVISGGAVELSQALYVGLGPGTPGQVNISGGNLAINGGSRTAYIGAGGQGQIVVSSGSLSAGTIYVGSPYGVSGNHAGTLTISGGSVQGQLLIGEGGGAASGTVWYTSGTLSGGQIMTVGDTGVGTMYVLSNAYFQAPGVLLVGNQSGSVGSLSLQGGTSFGSRRIQAWGVGMTAGSTGTVWVSDGLLLAGASFGCSYPIFIGQQGSGRLSATNSTLEFYGLAIGSHGTIECVSSQFSVLNGGCAVINSNMMLFSGSTGAFYAPVQNVGSIVADSSTLTFSQPVNNSGWIVATNASVQFQGGITNSGAVLLGPNQFCVTSVTATGNDVVITWQAFGGNDYRVQAASTPAGSFSDISVDIIPSGGGLSTTNYVDSVGLTNIPSRFYRIRQIY